MKKPIPLFIEPTIIDTTPPKDQIIKLVEHIDLLGENDFIERLNGIREHLTSQKTTTEGQSKLLERVIDLIDGFVEKEMIKTNKKEVMNENEKK